MATKTAEASTVESIEKKMNSLCVELGEQRETDCYPLLLGGQQDIHAELVDRVFGELRKRRYTSGKLDVVIASSGGDINAAYNLALLFRRFSKDKLTFIITTAGQKCSDPAGMRWRRNTHDPGRRTWAA